MDKIIIKPLTPELTADYLDFFDHRAFTDNNPNGPCYCTSPNQDEESIQQMVSEFKTHGVKDTIRQCGRYGKLCRLCSGLRKK